jgi:predicted transposase YbfD/YdcC
VDSGNEYVIQVKKNQKKLYQAIDQVITTEGSLDQYEKVETNKGRSEVRTVRVFKADVSVIPKGWEKLNRVVEITNHGWRDGRAYRKRHLYITSLEINSARDIGKHIRNHWCIENNLHRVKDVLQNEDHCLIVEKRIAANLSLIKSIVISLFRVNGYHSIKKALERYRNRVEDCAELMGIKPILKK